MTKSFAIKINESPQELEKNNPGQFTQTPRPPGVNFYSAKWASNTPGIVKVDHGAHSFMVESVISATGNDDPNFPTEKIFEWNINAGVSDDDLISHDDARLRFFSILKNIRKAGWTQYHGLGHPRLTGKDALLYSMNNAFLYGLDPDYVPTLEEWMSLADGTRWRFYADHAYIDVSLWRDRSKNDIREKGAYFIKFGLTDENEQFRKIVGSAKRANWKELLPAELKRLQDERKAAENALRDKGMKIDENYKDPPIPEK